MRTSAIALGFALLALAPAAASAQSAASNFTYKAPSGMFGEGTLKWQTYQYLETDAERAAQLRAGALATGSVGNASSTGNYASYPRPGEPMRSQRRPTAR